MAAWNDFSPSEAEDAATGIRMEIAKAKFYTRVNRVATTFLHEIDQAKYGVLGKKLTVLEVWIEFSHATDELRKDLNLVIDKLKLEMMLRHPTPPAIFPSSPPVGAERTLLLRELDAVPENEEEAVVSGAASRVAPLLPRPRPYSCLCSQTSSPDCTTSNYN